VAGGLSKQDLKRGRLLAGDLMRAFVNGSFGRGFSLEWKSGLEVQG
jgi:hypothetical protein